MSPSRCITVIATAAIALVGAPTPADAHPQKQYIPGQGDTPNGYVYNTAHDRGIFVEVCDTRANNVGVYVEISYRLPGHRDDLYRTERDKDGKGGECGDWVDADAYNVCLNGHSRDGYETGWYCA